MSIRNKRLLKEQLRLDEYELHWPIDWYHKDIVHLQTVHKDVHVSIKIDYKYPFQYPCMTIKDTDYIQWLLNKYIKYKLFFDLFNIKIPCICCESITCKWTPSYGLKELLDDFIKYNNFYFIIDKFKIIYKKIDIFDDLIYQTILNFLYYDSI